MICNKFASRPSLYKRFQLSRQTRLTSVLLMSVTTMVVTAHAASVDVENQRQSTIATITQSKADDAERINNDLYPSDSSATTTTVQYPTNQNTENLIKLAREKGLASHPTWLRLHFYEQKSNKLNNKKQVYSSHIKQDDFFVSADGKTNPKSELEAFIRLLTAENVANTADHVACRFPARTHWVRSQLGMPEVQMTCPELDAWMDKLDPKRLSVIYAEQYPDRPVSAFGHTLMLIDSAASLSDVTAIDKAHALNATVGGDANDSFMAYAWKSTFGIYLNEITIEPFPEKLSEYLQRDNRDVWSYTLNLTDAELQQIMRHVWETKDVKRPYYFTLDNCASEILRYIDVVRPEGKLLDNFKVAVVPSDVIRLLQREGLISQQAYIPADTTLAQAKLNNAQVTAIPESSIDANGKLAMSDINPADNNPLMSHELQRFMLGAGRQDDNHYLSLSYRGGFHDLLDRPSGYPDNFHLEAGSIELRAYTDDNKSPGFHDDIELQQLTILRGRSFSPINSASKGESLLSSWGVNLQAVKVKDGSQMDNTDNVERGSEHLVGHFAYEKGASVVFGSPSSDTGELPPHLCYALGSGMAEVGKGLSKGYRVGVAANIGCRYQLHKKARLLAEVQLPYWYHGASSIRQVKSHYWQPIVSVGAQYDITPNQAIRLQASHEFEDGIEEKNDIELSFVHHF